MVTEHLNSEYGAPVICCKKLNEMISVDDCDMHKKEENWKECNECTGSDFVFIEK